MSNYSRSSEFTFNKDDTELLLMNASSSLIRENPLFYQILLNKNTAASDIDINTNIQQDIIYIDFNGVKLDENSVFNYTAETRTLLKDGFSLNYDGTDDVKYVKFERSGSMAREKKLSFIKADIKDDLEKRLRLDISPNKANLSKWYAYNGLMLSSGTRIDADDTHAFDEHSVIVVNLKGLEKLFDGEGIVSKSYAEHIRSFLSYDEKNEKAIPTSFQIRMPFIKGMLHEVDFHKFAKENNITEITDCWGEKHDIDNVQIILTVSQFKGKKWFNTDNESPHAMSYYFQKFKEYNHALYITGYNKPHSSHINLNWQLLSTPALKNDAFLKIAEPTAEIYSALTSNDAAAGYNAFLNSRDYSLPKYATENDENPAEDISADKTETDTEENTFSRFDEYVRLALKHNPDFAVSKKAIACRKNMAEHILRQYGKAQFIVKGYNLYLSGDLLYFLYKIFDKTPPETEKLFNNKFYAPGVNCSKDNYYAVLRNPHVSEKELISLKPFFPSEKMLRHRYFSHLNGVLMINSSDISIKTDKGKTVKKPSIAERLSGADYDGDIVKLVLCTEYNSALPQYDDWSKAVFEEIPHHNTTDTNLKSKNIEEEIYKMVTLTFGTRIGKFSNYAFKHAVLAYNANNTDVNAKTHKDAVDKLFAVLGQEIDSAKTGFKPEPDKSLSISDMDYFIDWKNNIKHNLEKKEWTIKSEQSLEPKHTTKNGIIVPSNINLSGDSSSNSTATKLPNLYTLPYYTLIQNYNYNQENDKLIKKRIKNTTKSKTTISIIESYISDIAADDPKKMEQLKNLVAANLSAVKNLNAQNYMSKKSEAEKKEKTDSFTKEYMIILFRQYNDYDKKRDIMRRIVIKLHECKTLEKIIKQTNKKSPTISAIAEEWCYCLNPENYLKEKFNIEFDADEIALLTNFSYGGYKLLIIALNLALKVDYATGKMGVGSEIDDIKNAVDYDNVFNNVSTIKEIEYETEEQLNKIFGCAGDDNTDIYKKRLAYYCKCCKLVSKQNPFDPEETFLWSALGKALTTVVIEEEKAKKESENAK